LSGGFTGITFFNRHYAEESLISLLSAGVHADDFFECAFSASDRETVSVILESRTEKIRLCGSLDHVKKVC
jgi:hypothetical protein